MTIVPADEFRLTFETSRGPGGQNVNKVNTCAVLTFNVDQSRVLSEPQRLRLCERLGARISRSGELRLRCDKFRSQAANRREVVRRFHELMERALAPTPVRRATRPTAASRGRRRREKMIRSQRKATRRLGGADE